MIRHAVESDFEAITLLRKPYVLDLNQLTDAGYRFLMQTSGFIGSMTEVEFQQDIHHLFLVDEDEKGITGYLRVDRDHEYKDNDKKIWLRDGERENYFTGKHAEVGMIGVREDKKRQGIAGNLLDRAVSTLKKKDIDALYSIVVLQPLTNIPSVMFHEKHGFDRVAVSLPHFHFDLPNYQSILYKKVI